MPDHQERTERWEVLRDLENWLEKPMLVLSAAWLLLFILELTSGLSPALQTIGTGIWVVFVLDFALRLALAPERWTYVRNNVLTVVSLVVPAFRMLRALRAARLLGAARAVRGVRLLKVIGALNRGMRSLGRTFSRRGVGYAIALTLVVVLAGAAGMVNFERDAPGSPIQSYWEAVWWTSMVMTTMGTDYFPRTVEGRVLCLLLAVYAFAVFGYVTATLATFFIDRDAAGPGAEVHAELRAIRGELERLGDRIATGERGSSGSGILPRDG